MQKECEMCGGFYETDNKNRKYCDDCLTHWKRNTTTLRYAEHRMNSRREPKIHEWTCNYCGKTFKFPRKRDFCTDKCETQYKIEHNTCAQCGKPLFPIIQSTTKAFCSDDCRNTYKYNQAVVKGLVKTCPACNKKFIASSLQQRFCSQPCATQGKSKPAARMNWCHCPVCGKNFMSESFRPCDKPCSEKCDEIYSAQQEQKRAEYKAAHKQFIEDKKQTRKQAQKDKEVAENGLCGYCKVSYKDCPWMESEFRCKPEGAVYQNSKIVKCPLFKDSRK